jgi:hypothetical protein
MFSASMVRARRGARLGEGPTSAVDGGCGLGDGAVCLGIYWRGCGCWRAVDALVSNGRALVGISKREREW